MISLCECCGTVPATDSMNTVVVHERNRRRRIWHVDIHFAAIIGSCFESIRCRDRNVYQTLPYKSISRGCSLDSRIVDINRISNACAHRCKRVEIRKYLPGGCAGIIFIIEPLPMRKPCNLIAWRRYVIIIINRSDNKCV